MKSPQTALERMEVEAWTPQILNAHRRVEVGEDGGNSVQHFSRQSAAVVILEETFQAAVAKIDNHLPCPAL
jgi:hypothetical protein